MSRRHPLILSLLLVAAALTPATSAQMTDADIELGQKLKGTFSSSADEDLVSFSGIAGQKLILTVKGKKKVFPVLTLLDDTLTPIDTSAFEPKAPGGRVYKIKGFLLPETGDYFLTIAPFPGSKNGGYTLNTKGVIPKALKKMVMILPAGDLGPVEFEAAPGALITGRGIAPLGSPVRPTVTVIEGPTADIDLTGIAVTNVSGKKVSWVKAPATEYGTHSVTFGNNGTDGDLKVIINIKFPKVPKMTFIEEIGVGSIAGTLTVQELPVIAEQEPNDTIEETQLLGTMTPGTLVRVVGAISSGGDPLDGYRIFLSGDTAVTFQLLHDADTTTTDFDILLCDPDTGIVGSLETALEPEQGTFVITGFDSIDVLVVPFVGTGSYILTMTAGPAPASASAQVADGGTVQRLDPAPAWRTPGEPGATPIAAPAPRPGNALAFDRFVGLDREFLSDEVVVKLNDPVVDRHAWAASLGMDVRIASPSGWFVTTLPELAAEPDGRARRLATLSRTRALAERPEVYVAEPNWILHAAQTPDDSFYSYQWHYPLINLPAAWAVTTGSAGVIVAIIDTGITAHPDLIARDTGTGYDMISLAAISLDGGGLDPNPADPGDQANQDGTSSWHGTHVAGTVGASTNNGNGVSGVDWACGLMHVRVLGKGGGTNFDILEGIRYAAGLPNASLTTPAQAADVINMSLGGGGFSQATQDACTAAHAAGTVVIAAAGNENSGTPSYPASYDNVISVAAVDLNKVRAPYSNFGAFIDVAAPGGNTAVDANGDGYQDGVLSTLVDEPSGDFAYVFYQGTSMASPHVAGVAALLRSVDATLTPNEIEMILKDTSEDIGAPGRDDLYGEGLIDALAAVLSAQAGVGGGGIDPILALSSTALGFGSTQSSLPVTISNAGAGTLNVTAITPATNSGGDWLSVDISGTTFAIDAGNTTMFDVEVDRVGLGVGTYTGSVTVNSDGGDAVVAVAMEVTAGAGAVLNMGTIFVLAVDPVTFESGGQDETTSGAGDFLFDPLPEGLWLIGAGPDLDDDGFICGPGEPCGLFPVLSDPILIGLVANDVITGADFAVTDSVGLFNVNGVVTTFAKPPGGFRILPVESETPPGNQP